MLCLSFSLLSFSCTRSPPNSKRFKTSVPASAPSHLIPQQPIQPFPGVLSPFDGVSIPQTQMPTSPSSSRKRRSSPASSMAAPVPTTLEQDPNVGHNVPQTVPKKKGRTNTPWTAEEEQRLKSMRDAGCSWSEIAKVRRYATVMMLDGTTHISVADISDSNRR